MSTTSDVLGRYYTANSVGALLVASLPHSRPNIVLDLGAGDGALTSAAAQVWKDARYYMVDIDSRAQHARMQTLSGPSFIHHVGDALEIDIGRKLGLRTASADVAICNPPYIRPKWKNSFAAILEDAGLSGSCRNVSDMPADILFIAQNLRFLKAGGRLGIIVPDGVITGEHCAILRETLATIHTIQKVIELPRHIFSKTDAKAHIVILSKGASAANEIEVQKLMSNGKLSDPLRISKDRAGHRLDYTYLSERVDIKPRSAMITIRDVVEVIKRGAISSADRGKVEYPVLHTSDLMHGKSGIESRFFLSEEALKETIKGPVAKHGDILVARVGRNLQEKVSVVKNGSVAVTDCIFVLRVAPKYRRSLLSYLLGRTGRKALSSAARGVSARYLTAEAILEIPFKEKDADR